MKNILDLRFIIGLFFGITGIILIIGSFVNHASAGKTETVNFWAGIVYVVFCIIMFILWLSGRKKKLQNGESSQVAGEVSEG